MKSYTIFFILFLTIYSSTEENINIIFSKKDNKYFLKIGEITTYEYDENSKENLPLTEFLKEHFSPQKLQSILNEFQNKIQSKKTIKELYKKEFAELYKNSSETIVEYKIINGKRIKETTVKKDLDPDTGEYKTIESTISEEE